MNSKFKLKNLFLISFAALAGAFSANAVYASKMNNDFYLKNTVKEASADSMLPEYIYIGCTSNWLSAGWSVSDVRNTYINFKSATSLPSGYTTKTEYQISSLINDANFDASIISSSNNKFGVDLIKIKRYGITSLCWQAKDSSAFTSNYTEDTTIPSSEGGLKNTFIVDSYNTNYTNQNIFWTYYSSKTSIANCSSLYFSTCRDWGYSYWEYEYCMPYMVVKNSQSTVIYESGPAGVIDNASSLMATGTGQRHYNYYFVNVPLTNVSSIVIYHSYRSYLKTTNKLTFSSSELTSWANGTTNFYGMGDNASTSTSASESFYYDEEESKAFLRGSFANYSGISWDETIGNSTASSGSGGDFLPNAASSFFGSNNDYKITLDVKAGDSFILYTYDYLNNVAITDGYHSRWAFNAMSKYGYSSLDSITILDENNTGVINKSDYIESGSLTNSMYPLKFKQGGVVVLERDTSSSTSVALTITFVSNPAYIGTSDGHILVKLNSPWTDYSPKTAVHFWGSYGSYTDCYTKPLTSDNYLSTWNAYLVDVPKGSWTGAQLLRVNPSCTITTDTYGNGWDDNPYKDGGLYWGQSADFTIDGTKNWFETGNSDYENHYLITNEGSHPIIAGGESVYLDLNGYGWTSDNAVIGVMLENGMGSTVSLKLEMKIVEGFDVGGTGEGHLYETKVPSNQAYKSFKFFRAESLDGAWWNSTGSETQYFVPGFKNVFKLTAYENAGSFDWNFTDYSRVNCFAVYFLNACGCDSTGSSAPTITWSNAEAQFDNMCDYSEELFSTCIPDISESAVTYKQAAARYDYIVHKYGTSRYEDFASRDGVSIPFSSMNRTINGFINIVDTENTNTIIVIVSASISLLSITALSILLVKKRNSNRKED